MCVYRVSEMNGPHPSLIIGTTKNPATHPSMASYCGPLSSRVIKSIQGGMGGWRSKCKNCQLADQFPTSPSGGPSTATAHKSTIRVSKERQGRGSFQHYYKKNKFGGFAWLHLNWLYLSKMLFMTYEYTEYIPLINWNNIIQTEELYIYGNSTRPVFEFRIPTP